MNVKTRIAGILGGAALLAVTMTPAASAAQPASEQRMLATVTATAADGTTAAVGGFTKAKDRSPVRKCFRKSCERRFHVFKGEKLRWTKYAYNQVGNRWYYVHTTDGFNAQGWIYCGNVTASC